MKKKGILFILLFILTMFVFIGCNNSILFNNKVVDEMIEHNNYQIQNTQEKQEEPTYALTFTALSDMHLKSYDTIERTRFAAALQFSYTSTNDMLDAIVLNGDYTDGGHDPQYAALMSIFDEYSDPLTPRIVNHGNHENGRNESNSHEFFRTSFGYSIDHVFEVNGYFFITLGVHFGDKYIENQAKWLEQQLESAVSLDPEKPVFVLTHYPASGTVFNSKKGGNGRDTFKAVLEKYPQVINISGHSHPALNDPRVIHQEKFTSFNNSSFYYLYMEHVDFFGNQDLASAGHFSMIKVTTDNVVHIERYVLDDENFGVARKIGDDFVIDVKKGVSEFLYTQKWYDDGSVPVFEEDAFITATRDGTSLNISFDQAFDHNFVYYYLINIIDAQTDVVVHVMKIKSFFYLYNVPNRIEHILTDFPLSIGKEYKLQIYAFNPANRFSLPLEHNFIF